MAETNKNIRLGTPKKEITLEQYFKVGYILVVDDMQNMRRTIRNMLRQLNLLDVVEADDGDTALKKLKMMQEDGKKCAFVLLDWSMPRMPGIRVIRELRSGDDFVGKEFRDLPVMMITAETDMGQVAEAGETGVNGYLLKPFVAKTLEEKMLAVIKARANPPKHVMLIHAGEQLAGDGDYEKALACFKEAKKLSDSARIEVHIGEMYKILKKTDKAKEAFSQATEKNPNFIKAHTATASLLMEIGDEDAALDALEKANKISPNNSDRQMTAGRIHLKKGNGEKAQESFKCAAKADPQRNNEIAEEYLKTGDASRAEAFFRKSLEEKADDVHIYNRLGIALRRQGRWEDAITEYKKALVVDPRDEVIYYNMAKAFLEGGRQFDAEQSFQNALRINAGFAEAKAELAKLRNRTGA